MKFSLFTSLPLLATVVATLTVRSQTKEPIGGTVEYATACKSCPYDLCTTVNVPYSKDNVTLTCWTEGERVGDSRLWLKTTDSCYIPEYDLIEYSGDFSEDIEYCGRVPLDITREPATVRYLSECKWGYSTSSESIRYYGQDADVTLTCWAEGGKVMGDPYWYKTTDNCCVSGSGLWRKPDRSRLDNCGPESGHRANETKRAIDASGTKTGAEVDIKQSNEKEIAARWLQPEKIGEEYAPCYNCATSTTNSTCHLVKRYEYNQTVISQCLRREDREAPNGTLSSIRWMLTTDWCYVNGDDFWVPPWDNYRYPRCEYWDNL